MNPETNAPIVPPIPGEMRLSAVFGMLFAGLWLENFFPLRQSTQPKMKRVAVNLALAVVGALILRLIFFPIVFAASKYASLKGWGLLPLLPLPKWAELILALLLLDYTLYLWHVMNHKIPFLWRFHNVHHVDLDVDVSTASRFHFGELILSTFFRSGQVILFGIDPFTLTLFETLITAAAQFHHSNIRLPFGFESLLNKFMVTPRMHGIHHSIIEEETNSNYSTVMNFWDWMHGTIRLNVPQSSIVIGVPAYRDAGELSFWGSLILPFRRQRPWKFLDGQSPERGKLEGTPGRLVL